MTTDIRSTILSEVAARALKKSTVVITESSIDSSALARKLYSEEILPEDVYRTVNDRKCGNTNADRLENILKCTIDKVNKGDVNIYKKFLDSLSDLDRNDLAVAIEAKYEGM